MKYTINSLIYDEVATTIYRILFVDSKSDLIVIFDISSKSIKPIILSYNQIEDYDFRQYTEEKSSFVDDEYITESQKNIQSIATEIVYFLMKEPAIYISTKRSELVAEACIKFNVSKKTVYKYLKSYWKNGLSSNSLLPNFNKCGGKGKERNTKGQKLGRPTSSERTGINVNDEIKEIFRKSIDKFFLNGHQNTLNVTYQLMLKEYFVVNHAIKDNILVPVLKPENEIPTIGQFKYWYDKERNLRNEISKRFGTKEYELNNRAITGNSATEVSGPGSMFEIDATILDLFVVSRFNREWIVGRPILYIVIDTFSKMVTGFYIGFEGPSWTGAMMALANTCIEKVAFCKEYGIEINEGQWDSKYVPDAILADRGEFEGQISESIVSGLNIRLLNTASYRGDMKGNVERFFNTIHQYLKPQVPGYLHPNFQKSGAMDYRKKAHVDLHQLTQIIIKCILHYNNHYMNEYIRTEDMIKQNIQATPNELWKWGINNLSGRLRSYSAKIIQLNLLPRAKASVTPKGIRFKNIFYSSQVAIKEHWFENARSKGSWKITIVFDIRDLSKIYIKDANNRDFETCFLIESNSKYFEKSLHEVEQLNNKERDLKNSYRYNENQSKVELFSEIEEIINRNPQKTIKTISDIAKNRLIEKNINRTSESFNLEDDYKINVEKNIETEVFSFEKRSLELLKKKQKEHIDEDN